MIRTYRQYWLELGVVHSLADLSPSRPILLDPATIPHGASVRVFEVLIRDVERSFARWCSAEVQATARAVAPAPGLKAPPAHVCADILRITHVPADGRLIYVAVGRAEWEAILVAPQPAPAEVRCVAIRRVPNFSPYPYWGVGIFQARPRRCDGVWTWRAVDWAEPWVYPHKGRYQPHGYQSIAQVPLKEWAERLNLPVMAVTHGQRV